MKDVDSGVVKDMKNLIIAFLMWGLVAVYLLYLNVCTSPLADDWTYNCLDWQRVIPDTWREYFDWNPRVSGTFFTRVFALLPNGVVDVINTVLLLVMYIGIVCLAAGNQWKQIVSKWYTPLLLLGMSLFMMVAPGQVILWHCGVAFYLLPMVAGLLLVVSLMDAWRQSEFWNPSIFRYSVYFILTFIVGMGTFNLAGAIFLLGCVLVYRNYTSHDKGAGLFRSLVKQWKLVLLLSFIVVYQVLVVVSPANMIRMSSTPPEDFIDLLNGGIETHFSDFIARLFNIHIFRIVWVYAAVILGYTVRRVLGEWTREDSMLVYGFTALFFIAEFAIFLSPIRVAERVYAPALIFMMVAAFRILYPLFEMKWRIFRWAVRLHLLIWVSLVLPASASVWEQKVWWDKAEKILKNEENIVHLPYCPLAGNFLCGHFSLLLEYYMQYDGKGENNLSRVYGKNRVFLSNMRAVYTVSNGENIAISDDFSDMRGGTLSCVNPVQGAALSRVLIYYPSSFREVWYHPSAVWERFRCRDLKQADAVLLKAMGYESAEMTNGKIEWASYPKAWSKPAVPTIWVQTGEKSNTFERCDGKPDWR